MKALGNLLDAIGFTMTSAPSAQDKAHSLAMLRLAMEWIDGKPIEARQFSPLDLAAKEPLAAAEKDLEHFWHEPPVIEPRPETIEKALAAIPPPAAGAE